MVKIDKEYFSITPPMIPSDRINDLLNTLNMVTATHLYSCMVVTGFKRDWPIFWRKRAVFTYLLMSTPTDNSNRYPVLAKFTSRKNLARHLRYMIEIHSELHDTL